MLWKCKCYNPLEGDCCKLVEANTNERAREIFEKWLYSWQIRAYQYITVGEAYVLTEENASCKQVKCCDCKHIEYKKDGDNILVRCKYKNKCSLKALERRGIIDRPFFNKAETRKELP